MLSMDAKRAREMFEDRGWVAIPRVSCESTVVPALDYYYETVRLLIEKGLSPGEIRHGDQERFALEQLQKISTPSEAFSAARMLSALKIGAASIARRRSSFLGRTVL